MRIGTSRWVHMLRHFREKSANCTKSTVYGSKIGRRPLWLRNTFHKCISPAICFNLHYIHSILVIWPLSYICAYISTSLCSETFVTHSGKYGSIQVNTIYHQGPIMPIPFDRWPSLEAFSVISASDMPLERIVQTICDMNIAVSVCSSLHRLHAFYT